MKIAFIGARGVIGKYSGIETYYEEVGSRLVARGHEVTAYCRSYFTPAVAEHRGIRIRRLPTVRGKHSETIVHSLLCTLDAAFRSYDIVQFHAIGSAPLALLPRFVGKRTIVSVRGLDGQRAKWGRMARAYLSFGEWASARCPSATNVVSRELQKYFAERYGASTTYIPNGIDACEQIPPDEIKSFGLGSRDYVLYVGRLTPEKDCHTLIEAFRRLSTNARLVFVGGATYSDEYVRELRRHESDRILFLGFQSGQVLAELFSNALVYVLPSRIEGLSISLLEAMGYGNCVLTSDIPENRELVEGVGFTFKTGDVSDLARQLGHLLTHPEIAAETGRACRDHARREYGWDRIAEETEAAFKRLIRRSGPGLGQESFDVGAGRRQA
jgi:glycosyltransferase involved in cell wall biosynthesis